VPAVPPPVAPAATPAPAPDTSRDNVPARVNVLELTVRAAPSADAAVLRVLPSGTLLTVSPGQKDGWRRTRLPDGQICYVANAGLDFGPSPAAPAGAAAPVEPLGAKLHAKIYIKDLDQLAGLVAADPVVSPMVQNLIERRQGALGAGIVGGAAGAILTTVGFFVTHQSCTNDYVLGQVCTSEPSLPFIITGLVITTLSATIAGIVYPKHDDYLDVINAWNPRHLDDQLSIEVVGTSAGGARIY
jgi:hypothetical protein